MAKPSNARVTARGRRGEYLAGHELRYTYRCAACQTSRQVSFGKWESAPVRLREGMPAGWVLLECEPLEATSALICCWLCATCAATPDESRALAVLRHPDPDPPVTIRFRCWACDAPLTIEGPGYEPSQGWQRWRCLVVSETLPVSFWLCPPCSKTPEESLALVALRNPIIRRILP